MLAVLRGLIGGRGEIVNLHAALLVRNVLDYYFCPSRCAGMRQESSHNSLFLTAPRPSPGVILVPLFRCQALWGPCMYGGDLLLECAVD